MKVVRRGKRDWWIIDVPGTDDCGPYPRKEEADEDRRGMERFFKYQDKRGFVTTERRRPRK